MDPRPTPRIMPVPQSLPGGLTLDQLDALYARLDILRIDLAGLLDEGYLPSLRVALNLELARIYQAMTVAHRLIGSPGCRPGHHECRPGHHRLDCGFVSDAQLAEIDGLRLDAQEREQAAIYEEIAEAEERAAWGDR